MVSLFRRRFRRPLEEPQRLGFYQVFLGTQGEGRYTVDFKTHTFGPGNLVFSAPGQVQQFHPAPKLDGILLVFTDAFFVQEPSDQQLLGSSLLFDPWTASPSSAPPTNTPPSALQLRSAASSGSTIEALMMRSGSRSSGAC